MRKTAVLALAVSLVGGAGAHADGMLDPSFGNGGLVTTDFGQGSYDGANSLVLLPDGRAVASGRAGDVKPPAAMAAARYLPSGALDTSFGGDGRVALAPTGCTTGFGGPGGGAAAALLQPDGRLVLVGLCSNFGPPLVPVFWVVRLNVDGSLDPSFGTGGQVYLPFPGPEFNVSYTGLLQPDGRIVTIGQGEMAVMAARFNPDGSLDPTFGVNGQATVPLANDFMVGGCALQPDGKLLIAGRYGSVAATGDFGLLRLLPNGAPDPSFGGDGLVTSDFGGPETGHSVIVLGDGRLLLGGNRGASPSTDFALVRYLPDGALDTSFGTGGLVTANAGGDEFAGRMVELPNGKVLQVGSTDMAGGRDFLLARFHPDGDLDTSFGKAGFLRTDFGTPYDGCSAVAIAGPDLILTAGFTWPPQDDTHFALARYIASTPVELLGFEVE